MLWLLFHPVPSHPTVHKLITTMLTKEDETPKFQAEDRDSDEVSESEDEH